MYLIVDGYNVIGNWPELMSLAEEDFAAARDYLKDTLASHCGYTGEQLVLVFDAHQTRRTETTEEIFVGKGRHKRPVGRVVYTRKGETADNYIERFVRQNAGETMTVVSGDRLVQVLTFAYASRMSARELQLEVRKTAKLMEEHATNRKKKFALETRLGGETYVALDEWRRE
ncbi:MAG: NYN domain-containing protein [Christensenellales bacterium]|jgi:predicted RNA-binding protein with PIN domain